MSTPREPTAAAARRALPARLSPDRARSLLEDAARVQQALATSAAEPIASAAELLVQAFRAGRKALLFGNGGSAADAQHIAAEWSGRLARERAPLPALALGANPAELTALANDYGFERVFARLVEAHGRPGDVAIAISTSGRSPNVLAGVEAARAAGLRTIALTGRLGTLLAERVDVALRVPSDDTQRIQEAHLAIGHVLAALVDEALFPAAE